MTTKRKPKSARAPKPGVIPGRLWHWQRKTSLAAGCQAGLGDLWPWTQPTLRGYTTAMFEYCQDVAALSEHGFEWFSCYLTTKKHMNLYISLFTVLGIMATAAPLALVLGFGGMLAKRSLFWPLRWLGGAYTNMVRGIPDIVFFMFIPLALDMGFELFRHAMFCPDWQEAVFQGLNFNVCRDAKLPTANDPEWIEDTYKFVLAAFAYALVYGAFTANVLDGAMQAVPRGQIETARAFGMNRRQIFFRVSTPQMWVYALPGLNNLWVLLVKATPLLFLLGIEDLTYWSGELGNAVFNRRANYQHGDWRIWYYLGLLIFYLTFTYFSQKGFDRLSKRFSRGASTLGQQPMAQR